MISLKFLNTENGKKISVPVEETVRVQALLKKFQTENILGPGPYYVETTNGRPVMPADMFRDIRETDFVIKLGIGFQAPSCMQLGIFVVDGSGSMREGVVNGNLKPADALDLAIKETVKRVKTSRKKLSFLFSVVAFGDTARVILPQKKVIEINENDSFDPTALFNNGAGSASTNIASGLAVAHDIAGKFLNKKESSLIHKVVVIVLSDGMCHHEQETRRIADKLKQMPGVEISCCHFETGVNEPGAVSLLKDICSNSASNYQTVYDAETIREFFIHSATTVAGGFKNAG